MRIPASVSKKERKQTEFSVGGVSNIDEHASRATGTARRNPAGDSGVVQTNMDEPIGIRARQ
jgi:hypothetical protein